MAQRRSVWNARAARWLWIAFAMLGSAWLYQAVIPRVELTRHTTPSELVSVAPGRRVRLHCEGERSAASVVLECGQGCGVDAWRLVQPRVARFARVCAFDRAGIGWSDPAPAGTRDAASSSTDLQRMASDGRIARPFVYVAHSAAAFHALVYLQHHASDVSGLVFVEGSHHAELARTSPQQRSERAQVMQSLALCSALAPTGIPRIFAALGLFPLPPRAEAYPLESQRSARAAALRSSYCDTLRREIAAFDLSAEQASQVAPPPGLPIVSLSGTADKPDGPPSHIDLDLRLARLSQRGVHWISQTSGHYIQLDQPELVVAAVQHIVHILEREGISSTASSAAGAHE
jgi:pimeloyl-ACP methyl ester carboxylesterase